MGPFPGPVHVVLGGSGWVSARLKLLVSHVRLMAAMGLSNLRTLSSGFEPRRSLAKNVAAQQVGVWTAAHAMTGMGRQRFPSS